MDALSSVKRTRGRHRRSVRFRPLEVTFAFALALTGTLLVLVPQSAAVLFSARIATSTSRTFEATGMRREPDTLLANDRFKVSVTAGRCAAGHEIDGVWAPPIKLLDSLSFAVDGETLSHPTSRVDGSWLVRTQQSSPGGLQVRRVMFVPDRMPATLIGLTFTSPVVRRLSLRIEARSALSALARPDRPTAASADHPDSGSFAGDGLVFEEATDAAQNGAPHRYAAVVGGRLRPHSASTGTLNSPIAEPTGLASGCRSAHDGRGAFGNLTYILELVPNAPLTAWFAVTGSDTGPAEAQVVQRLVLDDPERLLQRTATSHGTSAVF